MRWMLLLAVGLGANGAAAQEREHWTCKYVGSDGLSHVTKLTVAGTAINERLVTDIVGGAREWDYTIIKSDYAVLAAVRPTQRGFTFTLIDRPTGIVRSGGIETVIVSHTMWNGKCVKE